MASPAPSTDFLGYALVRCPRCQGRAQIDSRTGTFRLTCERCGLVQDSGVRGSRVSLELYDRGEALLGAPLWLETECCGGHRLWALNDRHLDYLAAYVEEKQRDRAFPEPPGQRFLAYKLPRWMKSRKHRDEVLKAISRLRATL